MSYPDLGCFAECLTCELCEEGLPGLEPEPDLSFDAEDFDNLFGDDTDWDDFGPPPEGPDNWWDDIEVPNPYPWVGPTGDGWGGGIGGKW